MIGANQTVTANESPRANGQSHPHELFALTDEQILEIEPEAQDVTVREDVAQGDSSAGVSAASNENESRSTRQAEAQTQTAQAGVPVLPEPPAWFAETMNDPQRGAEARALWEGAQRAEKEAASYREVFAKPEEARTAAERARVLDDIDRAYFAGDASQRAHLAAMMMREDPAVFREMVFEGLRALEAAGQTGRARSVADAVGAHGNAAQPGEASPATSAQTKHVAQQPSSLPQQRSHAEQHAQLAAYAAFERAANDDLERSVGSAIERTLVQALPSLPTAGGAASVVAQHAAPLQARLAAAIRQDVEKALQGDRQLGEQVAQILSGKRLDSETRAQVVRLIGERAQQLVPGATKRALNDWTQTTLSAHRGKTVRADSSSARREAAPLAPGPRASQEQAAQRKDAARPTRNESSQPSKGRLNYGKLSDEQILDL
jgi:hypothetical protein